jgi:hypothetical protein
LGRAPVVGPGRHFWWRWGRAANSEIASRRRADG